MRSINHQNMNTNEQKGYDYARGACWYLVKIFFLYLVINTGYATLRNVLDWGVDDSDIGGWNRSGLTIHTDAKTGVQYLSDGRGGLVRREPR